MLTNTKQTPKINEEGKINEGGRFQGMIDVSML
jgi:hypothetical protein